MLFDLLESGPLVRIQGNAESQGETFGNQSLVALAHWEEHCVECGAPYCYSTCAKYKPTLSRKCRRFNRGAQSVIFQNGVIGRSVEFLPWGKLELQFSGAMCTERWHMRLTYVEKIFGPLLRVLTRVLCFLPWNRNPIAVFRSLRSRLLRFVPSKTLVPTVWSIVCLVERETQLRYSIMDNDDNEVLAGELVLRHGWNKTALKLPPIKGRCRVRLFSIEGTKCPVIFTELDLLASRVDPAKHVKCVAWDLDNTIWDGILVEDGSDGVKLRADVVEVIKELDRRGIVNTICSKNDYDFAWKQLRLFGIDDYFVFPEINWNPKSSNLKTIAANMNLGVDAFAFVDDSCNERGEVKAALPMVRIFDEKNVAGMLDLPDFNPPITEASATRRKSYQIEMTRRGSEHAFHGSREEFLRSCEIALTCEKLKTVAMEQRCWELVNRTNQLTLAARRYSEAEFNALLTGEGMETYAISCRDKYGIYGVVGFIAVKICCSSACVVEFVMSCRVAKKFCEQSVMIALAEKLRERGADQILTYVVPTGRNGALVEAFDVMPFEKSKDVIDGREAYCYKLQNLHRVKWPKDLFRNGVEFKEVAE